MENKISFEEFVKRIPCHFCGALVSKEELEENGAYTYPDNFPYCLKCQKGMKSMTLDQVNEIVKDITEEHNGYIAQRESVDSVIEPYGEVEDTIWENGFLNGIKYIKNLMK